MKTDLYTKIVLTVIAVALSANLIKSTINPAMADSKHYATVPVNADGSINVKIAKAGDVLDVNIKSVAPYAFSYCDAIPVKNK
ncbi:hypothetical protein [Mucilaginibacter sp. SP1R1]|uniref:hypothetical protein n=1 Tax=Mucilaginibacter sp. SP1R1 TaxID=2723091 RepID=UPI001609B6E8|nr:hypothetical protein [Mucilaginibacter sp. SP1R1]MBB6151235.1 acetamidase/formamidase [Mucilaginibacter sp. SP1R1]